MSRLAKYNALSAEIKRCEREQAFLGFGGGVLDPRFVGTRNLNEGGDEDYDFSDDDDDDDDDDDAEEYPQPLEMLTEEEEMERLEKTLGIVVGDKSEETERDWDEEHLENNEQPRNITNEQIEALLQEFTPASYIPDAGNHSVSLTEQELRDIRGDGDVRSDPCWPI
jgi:hypothetical protein